LHSKRLLCITASAVGLLSPLLFSQTSPGVSSLPVGPYQIVVPSQPNQCIDVAGPSLANGAGVQIWTCGGPRASNQVWTLNPISTPRGVGYQIVVANSSKCLDVSNVSVNDGASIHQWQCIGSKQTNQIWQPIQVGSTFELISLNSGKCLDLPSGSAANGQALQQWACGNGQNPNQLWRLAPLTAPAAIVPTDGIPASYFGMTVLDFRNVTPPISYGTTRTWDSYPYLDWAEANPLPGVYNFTWLDAFLAKNAAQGRDVIYTFGRTPQWASSNPGAPTPYGPGQCAPPADLKTWTDYVTAVVSHAGGRIHYWELWNEPQDPQFYCGDIPTMIKMASEAYSVIKQIDPSAQVLAPSVTSTAGPGWLSTYLAGGGGQFADIMTFHGYWSTKAEDILTVASSYRTVLANAGQDKKPLWDTEASWAGDPSHLLYGDDARAAFVAKYYLLQWSAGVSRFIWYGYDAGDLGGLYSSATGPQGGSFAYDTMRQWMLGASLTQPCSKDASGTWRCELSRAGGYRAEVVWNSGQSLNYAVSPNFHQQRSLGNTISGTGPNVQISNSPILLESGSAF